MTRVLITGAGGQLGRELARAGWGPSVEPVPLTAAELDITDRAAVGDTVRRLRPAVIVNAAAYTDVDGAEDEPDRALAVNATAVGGLAEAADEVDALLVHVSTDYVFDGTKGEPYVEPDRPRPLGAYGRSKLAGERAALGAAKAVVLRSAWIYGALGSNFVTTMLRLAGERDDIGVVADQVGSPTAAADLATVVVGLVGATGGGAADPPARLYHAASPEPATRHELAVAVFEASSLAGDVRCRPLATGEYPTRALRPADGRLDSTRLAADLGLRLPSWRQSLPLVVAELEDAALRPSVELDR